jgi:hypothetical protein
LNGSHTLGSSLVTGAFPSLTAGVAGLSTGVFSGGA